MEIMHRALSGTTLRLTLRDVSYDVGAVGEPEYEIIVHDASFFDRVLTHGNLGFGEAWMDRHIEMSRGTLHGLLTQLLAGGVDRVLQKNPRLLLAVAALRVAAIIRGRTRNVRRHYDLGDDCFESFLDETMTYSCGFAQSSEDSLQLLQENKLHRICRKLRLSEGDRLLDVGCGFGGLLLFAAEHYGVQGCGVTNSTRHHAQAVKRAAAAGLSAQLEFVLGDFSEVGGEFDKVASIGMLEHVPRRAYPQYFGFIADRLHSRGLGLIHCIGANCEANKHDPFIQKYVFPGANQPRLSEITSHLERLRLPILDVENMIRHYGVTASRWLERFRMNSHMLPRSKYDERFRRMWEYFLHCGIAAAQASDGAVFQVLFGKDYTMEIPLERV